MYTATAYHRLLALLVFLQHGSYVELTGGGGRGGEEGGAGRRDVGPRGDLGPHGTTGETVDLQESCECTVLWIVYTHLYMYPIINVVMCCWELG